MFVFLFKRSQKLTFELLGEFKTERFVFLSEPFKENAKRNATFLMAEKRVMRVKISLFWARQLKKYFFKSSKAIRSFSRNMKLKLSKMGNQHHQFKSPLGFISAVLLSCFVLFGPQSVFCWGPSGHAIVAQLGDNMLTPEARAMVDELLHGNQTMESISSWPDDYVFQASGAGAWSDCLHYINIDDMDSRFFEFGRDCVEVHNVSDCCVVASVLNYTSQVYKDAKHNASSMAPSPPSKMTEHQRNQGKKFFSSRMAALARFVDSDDDEDVAEPTPLSFMIHFFGDIHQPLHVGYGCDAGGTEVNVTYFGNETSLHVVWDFGIIDRYCGGDWQSFATELQEEIDNNPIIRAVFSKQMNVSEWADESYNEYVRHRVYDFSSEGLDSNSGDPVVYPFDDCPITSPINIEDPYYERNLRVVKQRLMAGGIRLAQALNDIAVKT